MRLFFYLCFSFLRSFKCAKIPPSTLILTSMKKISLLLVGLLASTGCSLIAPYTITFTNTPGSVVDPTTATLDFVVSAPTLAYVSAVECEGADPIELLPIVADTTATSTLHKLSLEAMVGMPEGSSCEVTVTVFDPTTTEQASASIALTMPGEAVESTEETSEPTDADDSNETEEAESEDAVETEVEVELEGSVETSTTPVTEDPADTTTPTNDEPQSPSDSPATDEPSA